MRSRQISPSKNRAVRNPNRAAWLWIIGIVSRPSTTPSRLLSPAVLPRSSSNSKRRRRSAKSLRARHVGVQGAETGH